MSNQVNSMNKGLTVKDLVTTGIFTALLFVFVLVGGVFFATNPVLTFFMPAGGGLLAGPIYLLLIAKVHKRWSLSIMGVIMGIIWFVTGMHWAFALGYLIPCPQCGSADSRTAGRRQCWVMEPNRATSTPCRQPLTPAF